MEALSYEPDVLQPEDVDWRGMDLAHLYWKAKSGIPEAVDELNRRGA